MSGRKFCRICLNEVLTVSSNTYSSVVDTKRILENIFPGMNTSLTNPLHLCEECFNNVNFANRLEKTFQEKEVNFLKDSYINFCTRPYCGLCFRFQTPDVIFLHKDNYSIEALKGIIEIALSAFKVINAETNVCGVCWSWIKKIYSFKRRCFKIEEILKNFCCRNNLEVMTNESLDAFLFEQYCIRAGVQYPPKQSNLTVLNYKLNSDADATNHREYFRLTGQVFSNLPDDQLTELEKLNNVEDGEYDWLRRNEAIPVELNDQDAVPTSSEVELETSAKTTGECDGASDTDDEFDETLERSIPSSDVVIILDDDDTDEVLFTNEDKQAIVSTLDNEFDNNIDIKENELNYVEENIPAHFILKNKNIKYMSSQENLIQPGENNNNVSQEVLDNNLLTLDLERGENNKYCGFKSKEQHNSSTQGYRSEIGENINTVKNNTELIYCDTPQFSKIYQRCVNETIEIDSQSKEENRRSYNFLFENTEVDILLSENTRKSTHIGSSAPSEGNDVNIKKSENNQVILGSTFELFQSRFSNAGDINTSYLSNIDKSPENFEKDKSDDNVVLLDEDCFEVINESDNIIDMSNVNSYVKEMQVVSERKTCAGFQKNEIWGCHICVAKFSRRHQARTHTLFHEEPSNKYGKFQCLKCPYRAKRKGNLNRHSQLHNKAAMGNPYGQTIMYICPYCSCIYNVREDIQAHINEHVISWKSFHCGDCMYITNKSESLRLHYSKHHGKAKDPTFTATVNWEAPEYTV